MMIIITIIIIIIIIILYSLRGDVMLSAVAENTPDIYRFSHIAYDKPTHLKFFGHTILSQEGT